MAATRVAVLHFASVIFPSHRIWDLSEFTHFLSWTGNSAFEFVGVFDICLLRYCSAELLGCGWFWGLWDCEIVVWYQAAIIPPFYDREIKCMLLDKQQ
jgi:hypothetical protein